MKSQKELMKNPIQIRLYQDDFKELQELNKEKGIPISFFVRKAVNDALQEPA